MASFSPRSALIVFFGGLSYGAMAPVIKMAYAAGFNWQSTTAGQSVFGALIFGVALIIVAARRKPLSRITVPRVLKLMGTGMMTCSTCILYSISLSHLPVAVAIVLLFQFTWIGIVIQIIATRTRPHISEVLAGVMVVAGTLLASGLFSAELHIDYNPIGVISGLGSAVTCALFMFLTGRVETSMPTIQRGFIICCGAALLGLIVCPTFLVHGTIIAIAPYGFTQGLFALFFPVVAFAIGTPHLPTGISTILASAELPCSIVLSFLILGEAVDGLQIVGILGILCGVVVSQLPLLLSKQSVVQTE